MRILIAYPTRNQIKNDAIGAFVPSAQAFAKRRRGFGDTIDKFSFEPQKFSKLDTVKIYQAIEAFQYQAVAIFTHGVATALPQVHIDRKRCADFARALTMRLTGAEPLAIILYCCLTAAPLRGPNFAETLARELHAIGKPFRLFAHRTAGHCCANPNVTIYQGTEVIEYPKAAGNAAEYKKRMADSSDPLRYDLPFGVAP
jgi:hypothetical protein